MKNHISGIERRILAVLQEGFPKSQSPYKDMAQKVGISTKQLLAVLKSWKRQGKLRRIAVIVNHLKVGLRAGAMVVWQVEPDRVEQIGRILAGFKEVSHVYERRISKNWPYNVYSMVHALNQKELQRTVETMAKASGVSSYRVLTTEKELKKVGPAYT
jgi:DNA-binding Lrp family transcriptional regulator